MRLKHLLIGLFFGFAMILSFRSLEGKGLCVDAEFANLRKGPGLNFPISWVVYRYMPLESVSKKGRWYRVRDFEGLEHWIREDLVTSSMPCAVVKSEFARLRRGPGTHWPEKVPYRADKYLSFRVLGRQNDWVRLQDSQGDIVWVHSPLLWIR